MLVIGGRGDSSPTDSGIDSSEWEEDHRAGPRMSLDPYNYGTDSAWASRNGSESKKNGPDNGRPPSMANGASPGRSPKNSPILGQGKDQRKTPVQAASQFPARTNFLLEHLSSFTLRTPQETQVPAQERLKQTKELLAKGNQWTKEMEMRLTDTDVVLLDGETQDVVEVFSLNTIGHVHHFSDDPDLNSVLVFNTIQTKEKFAAMHLFQSDRVPAAVVATEIMKASSSKSAMPNRFASRGGAILPPPPTHPAPAPPTEVDQERLDLYEKSLVAQTIAAFSAVSDDTKKTGKPQVSSKYTASESSSDIPDATLSAELLEAQTNRDVQILNHCIDDIERLVMRTKKSAEAWKKLQKKKGKGKRDESPLNKEAQPPPEADFYDAFQKLKHALNLLGKLRHRIHNPNAAELVHYLFVPLSMLVRCTGGPEKAKAVVSPLLTTHTIDLLQNCLSSKETDFWMALAPNWTLPKSSKQFKEQVIPPYTPVFKDGWVPPEVIAGKDVSNLSAAMAANAANAAAVAQLTDGQRKGEDSPSNLKANPAVLSAAAKFRRLASVKKPEETPPTSPTNKGLRRVRVLFDFQARNSKELTVHRGEEVLVLMDKRQWWCVRNSEGSMGFVPSTIVEEAVVLPNVPTTPPPPVPTTQGTSSQIAVHKTETTAQAPPSSPSQAAARVSESPKIPHVELRHVGMAKSNRPVSAPPIQLVIAPVPPSNPPPLTPSPPGTPPPPVLLKTNGTTQKEATLPGGTDFTRAIQAKNLKRVDPEEEKKRREQSQQNRMSSTDMLNDELKRRMTSSQGGLTPRVQRKDFPTVDLIADSSASEVKQWLESKGFTASCVTALSGKSAKDLESMTKDQLKQACGDSEGSRVFSQFAVQKANWEVSNKGSELAFIMQKRKERSEVNAIEELENAGELRSIVADAKAAAAQEEIEFRRRTSSAGKKTIQIGVPATKPRPKSFAGPETKPRKDSKAERKSSQGESFDAEFIPPPPMLESEDQPTIGEASPRARKISSEDVESILREQRKQQELLLEHDKQLFLLEQLQRQKLELEQQKREFEEQQQRAKQAELQEQQKELHRQIQAQQDQLKMNEDKLVQQQRFLSTYENVSPQFTYAIPPVVPQMPVLPISGVPTGAPAYLPMGGLQPMYSPYPTAMAQPGMAHVVPSVAMPSVSTTPPPSAVVADNTRM